jgi:hypothetical protein
MALGSPTTVADLVARVQADLRGESRESFTVLSGSLSSSPANETVAVAAVPSGLSANAMVSCESELLMVVSVAGTSVTFQRGVQNTEVSAHASGTVIDVNPRFFSHAIGNTMVEEIRSWGQGLYRVATEDVAFGVTDEEVEFTPEADFRDVLAASFYGSGMDHPVDVQATVTPNANTTLYPSGWAVRKVPMYGVSRDSGTLRVVYSRGFDLTGVDFDTTLADIGIPESCHDVVIYGCLWRLLAPREIGRLNTTSQPQPRAKNDVPARATLSAAAGYKQLRDERLAEEMMRLKERYRPGGA